VGFASLHFSLFSAMDVASACNNGMSRRGELTVSRIYGSLTSSIHLRCIVFTAGAFQ